MTKSKSFAAALAALTLATTFTAIGGQAQAHSHWGHNGWGIGAGFAAGTLIGIAGGVALALNIGTVVPAIERAFGIQFLDKSVYYISELPSDLQRGDITLIALIALSLALLATLYPSWRAAKVNPAEALRYE